MAVKEVKDFGHSIKARLLNISRNEQQRYQLLLTRYLQERLLFRLSMSDYKEHFILKGGALLYAYERFKARPTLDIDFMGNRIDNDKANIARAFKEICEIEHAEDGVKFHSETIKTSDIAVEKKYPGVRLAVTATLDTIKQVVSIDIGFGDIVTPAPTMLDYPIMLDGTGEVTILAYSIETVIAEKFQTVIDRGILNSRMKDFYDLYTILQRGNYDGELLKEAVLATFSNRHTSYDSDHLFFSDNFSKDQGLEIRWNAFIRKLNSKVNLPFATVVAEIKKKLKEYWENIK